MIGRVQINSCTVYTVVVLFINGTIIRAHPFMTSTRRGSDLGGRIRMPLDTAW